MPSIEENRELWDQAYEWQNAGDEWSRAWGGPDMQWYGALYPRVKAFLPADHVLEIAPGYGRWTNYLRLLCRDLTIVDLSESCIDHCRNRFKDSGNIHYYVNDGRSLDMVESNSIDFVFSFDSLVHAEEDVIKAYLSRVAEILRPGGKAFIHHSNLGHYKTYCSVMRTARQLITPGQSVAADGTTGSSGTPDRLSLVKRFAAPLYWAGILDRGHMRAPSMTAEKFSATALDSGLSCVSQELINWGTRRLIDCISVLAKSEGNRPRLPVVWRNKHFMDDAHYLARISNLYGSGSLEPSLSPGPRTSVPQTSAG